jgi:hypothetical protein
MAEPESSTESGADAPTAPTAEVRARAGSSAKVAAAVAAPSDPLARPSSVPAQRASGAPPEHGATRASSAPPADRSAGRSSSAPPEHGATRASGAPPADRSAGRSSGAPLEETVPRAVSAPPPEKRPSGAAAAAKAGVAFAAFPGDAGSSGPLAAYEVLARSARLGDLIAVAGRAIGEGARARRAEAIGAKVAEMADEARLTREDADTRFGNVLDVLSKGADTADQRALASALWAHAVAESPRTTTRTEDEDRLAADIVWLAAHTPFDATPLLDRALGEDASDLWTALASHVRRSQKSLERGELLVACAALAGSASERAKALTNELSSVVTDPTLRRVLGAGEHAAPDEVRLEGEIVAAPRGPVATTLLAFTGILFAAHAVRLLARLALAYRRPAEVLLSESGIRVKTRTELLGRTLRERDHVILRSGLVRVVREVRFPRAAFYAGLLALAVGSYIGVRAFVDGVRAASPSLLLVGLLIIALGIAADFVLGTLVPGSRGVCRIAFIPRSGPTVCVGDVDLRRADAALQRSLAR